MRSVLVVSLFSGALALACGCEGPQVGSPGLEPPRPRDPEATDGGAEPPPPGTMAGGGRSGTSASPTGGGPAMGAAASSGVAVPPDPSAGDAGAGEAMDAAFEPADGSMPLGDNPLFLGLWVVEQPTHALYEATLYELLPGGELVEHDTYLAGAAPYDGYVTGTVANADSSVRCDFRSPWTSDGPRQLQLGSECTDGQPRMVQLSFPDGAALTGLVPTVESVDNESGWDHRDFPWSWRKCETRTNCVPF